MRYAEGVILPSQAEGSGFNLRPSLTCTFSNNRANFLCTCVNLLSLPSAVSHAHTVSLRESAFASHLRDDNYRHEDVDRQIGLWAIVLSF